MAAEIIMPRVDMDMTEGKIATWYVKNGDVVSKGQVIFEIETDKATMEVDAPIAGTVQGISAEVGVLMEVGTNLGWIYPADEKKINSTSIHKENLSPEATSQLPISFSSELALSDDEKSTGKVSNTHKNLASETFNLRATPLARSLARTNGIDMLAVAGSGLSGRIQAHDVIEAHHNSKNAAKINLDLNLNWMNRSKGIPLVLLHGFGAELNVWRGLLSHLQDTPSIGIDLPNHGKSSALAVKSYDEVADAILARLDQEGIENFHLLGHSMGGAIAIAMTSLAGQRVKSLSLLAPAGLGREINSEFINGLCGADSEESLKQWLSLLIQDQTLLSKSFVATAFKQLESTEKRSNLRKMAHDLMPGGAQSTPLSKKIEALRIPTKVIWGTEDKIIPIEHSRGLPARVGLHVVSGVGHLTYLEASEVVAELMLEQTR